jgi:hypothetical protein
MNVLIANHVMALSCISKYCKIPYCKIHMTDILCAQYGFLIVV